MLCLVFFFPKRRCLFLLLLFRGDEAAFIGVIGFHVRVAKLRVGVWLLVSFRARWPETLVLFWLLSQCMHPTLINSALDGTCNCRFVLALMVVLDFSLLVRLSLGSQRSTRCISFYTIGLPAGAHVRGFINRDCMRETASWVVLQPLQLVIISCACVTCQADSTFARRHWLTRNKIVFWEAQTKNLFCMSWSSGYTGFDPRQTQLQHCVD